MNPPACSKPLKSPCPTSSHPRLPGPVKSQAELRCVPSANMLIEKCILQQLTRNLTLAHIYLPGEGIREDERTRQNGRKRETEKEGGKEADGESRQ